MKNFSNNEYEILVSDLLGDMLYSETSYRGKISFVRQYAEVIIRKFLNLNQTEKMTLGANKIVNKLDSLHNSEFIKSTLNHIKNSGNDCTHTQHVNEVSKIEFDNVMDKLFDLLSILLINYFEEFSFGSNPQVMYSFSLLPPIIRYKVLVFLNSKDTYNIAVIDKLVLATLKAFNDNTAAAWVEENKGILTSLKTMSEDAFNEITKNKGIEIAMLIQQLSPFNNMYELCLDKIDKVGAAINSNGNLYLDFESALPHYQENGVLEGDGPEIEEFNDIMNFLYLGRKESIHQLSVDKKPFFVMNLIS